MLPLLSIKNLSIQFKNEGIVTNAVKQISLTVHPGELVAIVGESGSGKSVTALSILQLLPKQSSINGAVLFHQNNDVNLLQIPESKITKIRGNKIAIIFQEPMTSLNPVFTCGNQVMEVILTHQNISKAKAKQQTIELFKKVELPDPENCFSRYPHQLSGGQKQRLMIAMAISCNPSLLIADEPTTALDVTVQKTILQLIKSLQQENDMAVIFITHDLGIVADIADKIAVMYKGEIVEQGDSKTVLQSPKHAYTKALLACRPTGKEKGKRLQVVSDFLTPNTEKELKAHIKTDFKLVEKQSVLLDVKNLLVQFPTKKNFFGKTIDSFNAVDDVSFTVNKGDIVGLVGESGCGKTTLGRSILQLIKPSAGQILLNGKDLAQISSSLLRQERKELQIVFQDPYGSLNPRISIGNAILEPLKVHSELNNHKERREKVMELMEKVNLDTNQFNKYPHQFSGGQRQRICIARALVLNPSFLIFDESVSALDVSIQAQVLNLLNDLKAEFGFTSIFISHDLSVVHYLCNRILVMHKGKIVEEGDAETVYRSPQNKYTQQLLNAIPGRSIPLY